MNNRDYQMILIVGSVFGALTFVIAFIGGGAITYVFGPGTSGVITVWLTTIVVVNGGLLLPRFGTLLMINVVFAALAIPTQLFGPIGLSKIGLGICTGLVYEFFVWLLRRNRTSFAVAAGVAALGSVYGIVFFSGLANVPPSEKLLKFLHLFAGVYGVLGAIGAVIGVLIYNKFVKNSPMAERIRRLE